MGIFPPVDAGWKRRIKKRIADLETSMKAASIAAGLGETYIRDILERDREPGIDSFRAIARVLRTTVADLLSEEPQGSVSIAGRVGANPDGSILYGAGQGALGDAPMPPNGNERTVAVQVVGDSMRGIAEDGWLVYYDERRDPPTDDLVGQLCVIGIDDGRVVIKKLLRGRKRGRFDLESLAAPMIYDAKVEWAARVTAIVPRDLGIRTTIKRRA